MTCLWSPSSLSYQTYYFLSISYQFKELYFRQGLIINFILSHRTIPGSIANPYSAFRNILRYYVTRATSQPVHIHAQKINNSLFCTIILIIVSLLFMLHHTVIISLFLCRWAESLTLLSPETIP